MLVEGDVKRLLLNPPPPPALQVVLEYFEILLFVVLMMEAEEWLDEVTATADNGMVPVGSNPRDLFRLAKGHPDALKNVLD